MDSARAAIIALALAFSAVLASWRPLTPSSRGAEDNETRAPPATSSSSLSPMSTWPAISIGADSTRRCLLFTLLPLYSWKLREGPGRVAEAYQIDESCCKSCCIFLICPFSAFQVLHEVHFYPLP